LSYKAYPDAAAHYADEVMKDLLATQYKPKIPGKAQLYATRLDQLLAPYLPPPEPASSSKSLYYITSTFDEDVLSIADSTTSYFEDASAAWYSPRG
jgi:hypothetical protein